MALQKTWKKTHKGFLGELVLPNAYCKIYEISGSKEKINFSVGISTQKDGDQLETGFYSFTPILDGQNFIAQAYDYLKTLPEFVGATDC
jgi:hypothetical protein